MNGQSPWCGHLQTPTSGALRAMRRRVPITWVLTASLCVCVGAGAGEWREATRTPPWSQRASFSSLAFQDKLWVLGPYGDAWCSEDGTDWVQTAADVPCLARSHTGGVVFDDRMLIIAGGDFCNDIWSSVDGVEWIQETGEAPWAGRLSATCVAFAGKLWVMGGYSDGYRWLNDIWLSENLTDWTEMQGLGTFIQGGTIFDGKLFESVDRDLDSVAVGIACVRIKDSTGDTVAIINSQPFVWNPPGPQVNPPAGSLILKGRAFIGADPD